MSEEKATATESVDIESADKVNEDSTAESQDNNPDDLLTSESEATEEQANDLQAQFEAATAKADENWDLLLRTRADMDNLRRRAERDVESAHKFALDKFVAELLPVMDSLHLGLSTVGKDDHEQLEKLHEGTELTLKMFVDVLKKFNVVEINPLDKPFNPELHQAMVMQESADKDPNTVLMVMQKGYTLNERLVRPAMVAVSKAKSSEAGEKLDEKA